MLGAYQSSAEFGLMTFPSPNQCAPGKVDVQPALTNQAAIISALATAPPATGNWTPMAQTLEQAAEEPALQSGVGPRHVVLITDGWQWCSPYDPATRYDGVPAVQALTDAGVTTWIVGFGDEVDAAALNRMAVAAHTARPGCNPANTEASAPDNCYFQVDNATDLVAALTTIAGSVSDETCDGIDNDCDGQVDENIQRSCQTACGTQGVEMCGGGAWGSCASLVANTLETCDGLDNDCDGQVDNGPNLCDSGEQCSAGACQPLNEETAPGGELQAGCACNTGAPGGSSLLPFALLGLGFIATRRRR